MKIIKYKIAYEVNIGTEENLKAELQFVDKEIRCSEDMLSVNEEIAKQEAYNGEYETYDDGLPEPETPAGDDDAYADMAAAIREGVNGI